MGAEAGAHEPLPVRRIRVDRVVPGSHAADGAVIARCSDRVARAPAVVPRTRDRRLKPRPRTRRYARSGWCLDAVELRVPAGRESVMSAEGRIVAAFGRATNGIARRAPPRGGLHADRGPAGRRDAGHPLGSHLGAALVDGRDREARPPADERRPARADADRDHPRAAVSASACRRKPAGHPRVAHDHDAPLDRLRDDHDGGHVRRRRAPQQSVPHEGRLQEGRRHGHQHATGKVLSTKTTYIAAASAPPNAGSTWIQIQRTVVDAVTNLALPGASVNLTGGPDTSPVTNRTDTTDASGTVLFPAPQHHLERDARLHARHHALGVHRLPDDISPGSASSVASTVGSNSIRTIRMYQRASR